MTAIVSLAGEPMRRHFTVAEYHKMGEAGILTEDDRVELIEGEVLQLPPIGDRHAGGVNRLNEVFVLALRERAVVAVQNPVRLGPLSEPQPDLAILRRREDHYASAHPGPGDVLLLVEVSDSTITYDRQVKTALYARSGVAEVWIVDIEGGNLSVYRDPAPEGYRSVRDYRSGERIAPLAFPDLRLEVDQIL